MQTAREIARPLRQAFLRAKAALAAKGELPQVDVCERALRELVEAFEASDHALKGLVVDQRKDG